MIDCRRGVRHNSGAAWFRFLEAAMSHLWQMQTFDPDAEYRVVERRLPHWSQAGTLCFITWRTTDSIPASVLRRWFGDRDEWLRQHAIDPRSVDWKGQWLALSRKLRAEFVSHFSSRWHKQLDDSHGACVLQDVTLARMVGKSLQKFDGERYELTDFVVMPNHVHLLAAFPDEEAMLAQCESWKHFTAREINAALGTKGRFWQQDGFDHLVRSCEHFEAFRRYIRGNPAKARLKPGQYLHWSKVLS